VGWADGALDIAFAYGETPVGGQTFKVTTLGGSWDFGVAKVMGYWFDQKSTADRQVNTLLGITVPIGVGSLRASVARSDRKGPSLDRDDAKQFAVAYVHSLSRRTALYAAYARIANSGAAAYVTSDSSPPATPGGSASGLQVGVSHQF